MLEVIRHVCDTIFQQLGQGHSEAVYQKALILELYNMGATSVESEKHVPVFFVDIKKIQHTIGDERIDILARFNETIILIELKAVTSINHANIEQQVLKYRRSLKALNINPTFSFAINFPQHLEKQQVQFLTFD